MKKLHRMTAVLMVGVLLLTALSLTGCHGSRGLDAFEMPETFDTSRTYEITFWAKNDTNKTQTEIYAQAIENFEKLYPNIKVKIQPYTDYSKIYNDVITNISTGTTPNVCVTYPDHIATYMTGSNVVVPLDELMADESYGLGGSELAYDGPTVDEMVPSYLEECILEDHYYALPFVRSTEACYINKTYVEALGFTLPEVLTWDFIWEVCEAAMAQDEEGTYLLNGQKIMIPFIYKSTDNMMIQLLKQMGADYSDEEGNIGIFNETTKEILYKVSEEVDKGTFSTFKISSYPANFLNAGQCLFAVDSTAGATWMGAEAPLLDISEDKVQDFETEVMAIPQVDPDNPSMISQGPSICIFNKEDPQEVLASWLFAQYLLTNEVQIPYSETEGYAPVTLKAREAEEYQDYLSRCGEDNDHYYDVKIKATQLLLDNSENTFITPVFNGSASLRDAAGAMIENVAKSTRRNQTVDETYMEELFEDMNSLYRLDQKSTKTTEKQDLGPLPTGSKWLLISLGVVWVGILAYVLKDKLARLKKK